MDFLRHYGADKGACFTQYITGRVKREFKRGKRTPGIIISGAVIDIAGDVSHNAFVCESLASPALSPVH